VAFDEPSEEPLADELHHGLGIPSREWVEAAVV